jgi:hypothetical protein
MPPTSRRLRRTPAPLPDVPVLPHGNAKLTVEQVQQIRALAQTHDARSLAAYFKIAPHTVRDIVHRRTWAHVA